MVDTVVGKTKPVPIKNAGNVDAFKNVEADAKKALDKVEAKLENKPVEEKELPEDDSVIGTINVNLFTNLAPIINFTGEVSANIVKHVGARMLWRAYRRWQEKKGR